HTRFDCDWSSDVCSSDLICFDDLGRFRRDYVKEVLQDEIGELSALDQEVVESLQQHEILSSDISKQFEKKLTFGERLSDSIAARSEERRVGKEWRARRGG